MLWPLTPSWPQHRRYARITSRRLRPFPQFAVSSCPRQVHVRYTRRRFCRPQLPHHQPQHRHFQVPAFSVAVQSLIAGLAALQAVVIRSARPAAPPDRVSLPAVHAPSIPRAQRQPVMLALAVPAVLPEAVPLSVPVPASAAHLAPAASAARVPAVPAALHPPAKHLVRSVLTRPRAAVDARSIPRRRKAP